MLVAFKEELKRLAADPNDEFHIKVKKRIGKRATEMLEKRLRQLILVMPSLVKRIHMKWENEPPETEIKKLGGFVFAYLYHPQDFLAEGQHGLFGYLDDAYLVGYVYEQLIYQAKFVEPEDIHYLEVVRRTKRYVRAVIPKETKMIEAMVKSALAEDKFENFASAFSGAA